MRGGGSWRSIWLNFAGTALLILLGDGVVAGVLLRESKAENSGWIVITFGWGSRSPSPCTPWAVSAARI
jgi:glycerol uptake facilitator-like aquaporin